MARLRKAIFNGGVYCITTSVENGLMLPANPLVKLLIYASLFRAHLIFPELSFSHFLFNGTHAHFFLRCFNPEDIPGFMERFKTESSHYLNRVLGRGKRTIWCDSYDCSRMIDPKRAVKKIVYSYDCSRMIDPERAMKKIVYIYTNSVKDGLIKSIKNYPGISSWANFCSSKSHLKAYKLSRAEILPCSQEGKKYEDFKKAARQIVKLSGKKIQSLPILDTDDWYKGVWIREDGSEYQLNYTSEEIDRANTELRAAVAAKEKEIQDEKKSFMGRVKLENQAIDVDYHSPNRKRGRKLWCESGNRKIRVAYISFLKRLAEEAREVYLQWKQGDLSEQMPIGMFAPAMPRRANLIASL